jgi:nicotinate phosphoribosyltransferase
LPGQADTLIGQPGPACGSGFRDLLALRGEPGPAGSEPLLECVMRGGARCGPRRSVAEDVRLARRRFRADVDELPAPLRAIRAPVPRRPDTSTGLKELTTRVRRALEHDVIPARSR